jgi:hypothetical protein
MKLFVYEDDAPHKEQTPFQAYLVLKQNEAAVGHLILGF